MNEITSLSGPVEEIDEKLILRIPLAEGGEQLQECSRGISKIEEGFLCIEIHPWLVQKLELTPGRMVTVDNRDGKFNIRLEANP